MKSIKFESLHGQDEVHAPDVGMYFKNGQIRQVSDEDAVILLSNPNFKEIKDMAATVSFERGAPAASVEGQKAGGNA